MTKSKHTQKALLASMLSTLLCCAMLIGSTFAWFTDSVASGKNKITAGNLDVELEYMAESGDWESASGLPEGTLFNTGSPWEPGKVVYEQFRVVNNGSLAMKYYLTFRDIIANNVLIPNPDKDAAAETPYVFPQKMWDGEESYMELSLMDVLQVAYYPGTMEELEAALGGSVGADSREIVEQAVKEGLISFFDEENDCYNTVWETFELFGALAPAGAYSTESGDDAGTLDPVHLRYKLTSPSGGDVTDDDGEVFIDVPAATDTQNYTIFLYWEPDVIPFAYGSDALDLTDNDYNLNNGKVATPLITEELEALLSAKCTKAVAEDKLTQPEVDESSGRYMDFRAKVFAEQGKTHALEIDFDVRVFATQIPHESDSFDNAYDAEVNWPEVGEVPPPSLGD